MFDSIVNVLLFVIILPILLVLLIYVLLRKLIQPKWNIFESKNNNFSVNGEIMGIHFFNGNFSQVLHMVENDVRSNSKKSYMFINSHAVNLSKKDRNFETILINNDINLPDGIGMKIAGLFEGYTLNENLNGTDLFPLLMDSCQNWGSSVYLLGASQDVLNDLVQKCNSTWSKLKVVGYHHGYFDKQTESKAVLNDIKSVNPDLLFVSFGMPLQEQWISRHFDEINAKVIFATGGLFDFYSGHIKRAPKYLRSIGLEWLYRLYLQPGRLWKRYIIGNPLFLVHLIKARISSQ